MAIILIFYHCPMLYKVAEELLAFSGHLEPIAQAKVGQIAVTKCDEDSSWGRVRVEEIEDDSIKVRFLDFGSVEHKRLEEIFYVPESVMEFPAGAFLVSVNSKDEATDENRERIYELLETGEELSVELGSDRCGVFFIGMRQVLPEETLMKKPVAEEVVEDKKLAKIMEDVFNSKVEVEVTVTHIEESGLVWVTPVQLQEEVNSLMEELGKLQPELKLAVECKDGETFAAVYSEDGELYRCRVIGRNGGHLEVLFIDFGNTEEKSEEELLALPRHLNEEVRRGMAMKVQMAGVGNSEDKRVKLEESLTDKNLIMRRRGDGLVEFFNEGVRVDLNTPFNLAGKVLVNNAAFSFESPVRSCGDVEEVNGSSDSVKQPAVGMVSSTPAKKEVSVKLVSPEATIQQLKEQMDRELEGRERRSRPVFAMERNQVPVIRQPKGPAGNNGFIERKEVQGKYRSLNKAKLSVPCPVMSQELLDTWVEGCRRMLEKGEGLIKMEKRKLDPKFEDIEDLLTRFEDGEQGGEEVVHWLLSQDTRLANIAVLPTALPFLQKLLESEVSSELHPLAIELCSYPCLPTLIHHPTGHILLETLANKNLGTPTLHIARWLLRHLEEVVKCPHAGKLASNILPIIISRASDPNYLGMLTRCNH